MALPNKTKIPVGTVLAGKYRITREIGRGGMAAVYEAANVDIGKRVAIKVLAQELTASSIVVERFLREARAAAAIRSPYICDIYDSGKLDDGRPFLVLELLEGESLYERMTKIRWMDPETTVALISQTCRGLTKAHAASIVHRDLKPENIFITKDEEGKLCAKILDFGLAKFYAPMDGTGPQARLTREGAVFGTPAYMSPEQVRGQGAVDHRADLWALGCIVYECFTGRTVWSTEQGVAMTFAQIANAPLPRPSTFRPDLPPSFTTWFDRALNRDISLRFQTAKEFADELAATFHQPPAQPSLAGNLFESSPNPSAAHLSPPSPRRASPEATTEPPREVPSAPASSHGTPSPHGSKLGFAAPPSAHQEPALPAIPVKKPMSSVLLASLVAAGVVVVGGGGWLAYTQLIQKVAAPVPTGSAAAAASSSAPIAPSTAPTQAPVAHPPRPDLAPPAWVTLVREGQHALSTGDVRGAHKLMREAFDKGAGHGVPRTMMEHLQIAMSGGSERSACRLTGLSRPRNYDLVTPAPRAVPAGRPSIAVGPRGAVIAWTDAHEGTEHAYAVLLDDALRDVGTPVDVTPEATNVKRPEIRRAGDKIVLSYWDAGGPEAGVKVRLLDAPGHIAGPAVTVSPVRAGNFWPALTVAPDNSFFMAWSDATDSDSEDLFFAHLGPALEPIGGTIRATDLVPAGPSKPKARVPSIAVEGDVLFAAYRLERDPVRAIEHMRLPLGEMSKGLEPVGKKPGRTDRTIGEVVAVNLDKSKADGPSLACVPNQCFLVWHADSPVGAWAASIDPGRAQPVWRKKFSVRGAHPAVATSPNGQAQVAWYEGGKILTASITRDGVTIPTKIARVTSDQQPMPSIAPGNKPGEWYLAWLDFETGHLEAYAARVQCK